jgi:hypothetical protein
MEVYLAIYLLLVFTGTLRQAHGRNPILYFWIAFLFVFVGTREWTGCDFGGYLIRFYDYRMMSVETALQKPEALFSLLNIAIIELDLDYMWLNIAASFIIFLCFALFARRLEQPVLFMALAFPILIVQLAMSGIRQGIALAFLLLALQAFIDGRKFWTAIWILIASQFHTTALMFLPLVLIVGRSPSIWVLIAATVLMSPLSIFLAGERVDVYQSRYGEGDVESFGAAFRAALVGITAVFFEILHGRYKQAYPHDYALMRLFSLFSVAVAGLVFVSSIAAHRLGYYVMPVHILMLLRLPRILNPSGRDVILQAMPFLAYGLYIAVWFSMSRHAASCYVPYESYLF